MNTTNALAEPTTKAAVSHAERGGAERGGRMLPLLVWTDGVILFGLAIAAVPWVSKEFFNWVAFGSTVEPSTFSVEAREYLRFGFAILGAVQAGFGVSAWFLARFGVSRGERWAWNAIVASFATWFVVDCAASILLGFPRNVILNMAFTIPGALALWIARPQP
jgi:hypothetical protein